MNSSGVFHQLPLCSVEPYCMLAVWAWTWEDNADTDRVLALTNQEGMAPLRVRKAGTACVHLHEGETKVG